MQRRREPALVFRSRPARCLFFFRNRVLCRERFALFDSFGGMVEHRGE